MPKVLLNALWQWLELAELRVHSAVAQLIRVVISVRALMDTEDERFERKGN